jgi:hypothetical protein
LTRSTSLPSSSSIVHGSSRSPYTISCEYPGRSCNVCYSDLSSSTASSSYHNSTATKTPSCIITCPYCSKTSCCVTECSGCMCYYCNFCVQSVWGPNYSEYFCGNCVGEGKVGNEVGEGDMMEM